MLKRVGLVGLGVAGLGVASSALTAGVAHASATVQHGWKYCANCHNLYWGNNGGLCVGVLDSPHQPYSSAVYGVATAVSSTSGYQSPWRYCDGCSCLYYGPDQSASHCAANGNINGGFSQHNSGGTTYYLSYGATAPSGTQSGWRFCANCKVLFWGNAMAVSACPVYLNSTNEPNHALVDGAPLDLSTNYSPYLQ
jgi:hypothetical protein